MKKFLVLPICMLLLAGCVPDSTLVFEQVLLSEKDLDGCGQQSCPKISISYLQAKGASGPANLINQAVESQLIKALTISENEKTLSSIEEAMTEFIEIYRLHLSEFPDMSAVYTAEISMESLFEGGALFSFGFNEYLYTGGAHGLGQLYFLNFDPGSGKQLFNNDLLGDKDGFMQLAESLFRTEQGIAKDASINSTGFWFENEQFSLPGTMGITDSHVILVYNPYDIASYADGSIELKIPLEKARPFLSIPLQ
jgi:hypothetical protein